MRESILNEWIYQINICQRCVQDILLEIKCTW
jgi:hypothetical protein